MKQIFQTVKTLTKTFRPQLFCVKSKEGEIKEYTTPGARKQWKIRMRWMDNMEEWTGMPFEDLLKKTRDRKSRVDLSMVEDKTTSYELTKTSPLAISPQLKRL